MAAGCSGVVIVQGFCHCHYCNYLRNADYLCESALSIWIYALPLSRVKYFTGTAFVSQTPFTAR